MNLLEYAIQMEKDGEAFYRKLAEKCVGDEGMRYIFTLLADDEVKHRKLFEAMLEGADCEMRDTEIIGKAVSIFKDIQQKGEVFECSNKQVELYRQAYEIELKSYDYYMEQLANASKEKEKETIRRIAREEKRHAVVLENIIEMVTRPDSWIENAEFNHMEQY